MPNISKRLLVWSAPAQVALLNFVLPFSLSLFSQRIGWSVRPGAWNLTGIAFVAVGFALFIAALLEQLRSLKGSKIVGIGTPKHIIRTGPYRLSRNPMVLGSALAWVGWAVFFGSALILMGLVALLGIMLLIVIPWEERNLERLFGDEYLMYKKRVPRWIGRNR